MNGLMKMISVVIPAFNHADFLGSAIESVLGSDFQDVEVIVVDDGSIDHTREVVKSYPSVMYNYQPNQGAHAALNYGMSLASGKYLAILNDDDMYSRDHLTTAYRNLKTYGNDLFLGSGSLIGEGWKRYALREHLTQSIKEIEKDGLVRSLFNINWTLSTSSFVFTKKLSVQLGGFQNFAMCHDLDFLLRAIFLGGVSVGTSNNPTWQYRCHETNSGSAISSAQQSAEIVYCLGRALCQYLQVESRDVFFNFIGHSISHDLKNTAWGVKPWDREEILGARDSISQWIASLA